MAEKKKKTCNYLLPPHDISCGRELYDDKYCIFHSEDIEGKKETFAEAFRQEFKRQEVKEEKYDFEAFVFPADISFRGKDFDNSVSFVGARFSGDVDFIGAQFSGEVGFGGTQFSGGANFGGAQFFEEVGFGGVQFSGRANFREVQFSGKVRFGSAQFSGEADFGNAQFSGEADFGNVQFSGEADFDYARFSGDLLNGLFAALRNRGIQRIWEGRYKIKDFRFHMSEAIAREYPVIDRMSRDVWYLDDYKKNHPFIYALWNVMAKCGQSIFRWALWSLFFAFYFAVNFSLIYYVNPWAFHFEDAIKATNFPSFLYYSIVTFTTLGFGDIIPTANYVQRWVMAEVIMGYVMLGGLISILANKLARRS